MTIKKPSSSEKLQKQYDLILKALQGLYTDVHNTSDSLTAFNNELQEIKKVLIEILKYQKDLSNFEEKIYKKNLSS